MHNPFFYPDRNHYGSPTEHQLSYEAVTFYSQDGTRLSGWFIPAQGEIKGTVIHMHGNAQNMTAHWMFAGWLPAQGYNLFVFDYRGYGQSEGVVDEQGVFEDAVAAINHVAGRADVDISSLVVFGQSLGGMLAIAAAAECKTSIKGVAAEAPVHSYGEWAFDMMPELDFPADDTYCAHNRVAKLSPVPLLLFHGTADKVVPYTHSEQLLALAGEPKELITIPAGQHNDAMTEVHRGQYQQKLLAFFDRCVS